MTINIIAAVGLNNELGYKNELLVHLPNDLRRFKQLTEGSFVVQGRNTYESIGKPLPNRTNILLSRNTQLDIHPAVFVYNSIDDVLWEYENYAEKQIDLWIIGGAEVYKQFLPHADRIYLTVIDNIFKYADTYFPQFDLSDFKVIEHIENKADDKHIFDYHYITYEKRNK